MPEKICLVYDLGLIGYEPAWRLQEKLAEKIGNGEQPPTLLLLEHPHVYTFGRQGKQENLLWDKAELERRGVQVFWVDRGGDVTYHGPGQLVGYPLLPVAAQKNGEITRIDSMGYIRTLEQSLVHALQALGIAARTEPGMTGIWAPGIPGARSEKVAAIGVKIDSRGISRHGFAINVSPDMTYWQGIIGCGLAGYTATSISQLLDPPPSMEKVKSAVMQALGESFGYQMVLSSQPLINVQ
jgi:lipoate-protein ligase B